MQLPWLLGGASGVRPVRPAIAVAPKDGIVVFTVDDEERQKRAERASRFAPKKASFEQEEEIGGRKSADTMAADPAPEAPAASSDRSGTAEAATDAANEGEFMEDQIADYLLDMQQQYMLDYAEEIEGGGGPVDDISKEGPDATSADMARCDNS
jgi:hypothetical protein